MKKMLSILSSTVISTNSIVFMVGCQTPTISKINLNLFCNDLGVFDSDPEQSDILFEFNKANEINLILDLDVVIEIIDEKSATINAVKESLIYIGSINVKFNIKMDIKTLIKETSLDEIQNNQAKTIWKEFMYKNPNLDYTLFKLTTITLANAKIIPTNNETHFGEVIVTFKTTESKTIYKNKDKIESIWGPAPYNTKEILQIGFDNNGQAYPMPSTIEIVPKWINKNITDLSSLFKNATRFNQDLSTWNTANITNMANMFNGATKFNGNISNWITSNVTNMSSMFESATNFNQDLFWDTNQISNITSMFKKAIKFNGNISNWITSNVIDMSSMFYKASSFNKNLTNWDTNQVTSMHKMFYDATKFDGNISTWNVSNVTDMGYMLAYAITFDQNIQNWKTNQVTNMNYMFFNTEKFNQDLSEWNVENVKWHDNFDIGSTAWKKPKPIFNS